VKAIEFDHVGVFTYSHEEGTSAHALEDDLPAGIKRQRRAGLMRLQKQVVRRSHRRRIGQQVRVLVDGPTAEHDLVLRGRLEGQAPDIDPLVYLTDCDPSVLSPGQFVQAEIVASRGYDLVVRPAPA
jgi:ribosomal protein S12 methylthiotransferase